MFSKALAIVDKFTKPVVMSKRLEDGRVHSGCASFVVVNPEGWIITAAHVLQDMALFKEHSDKRAAFEIEKDKVLVIPDLKAKQRKKMLQKIAPQSDWLTNLSYYWSFPGAMIQDVSINSVSDLAIGRLMPFDENSVPNYPVFKNPAGPLPPGTSLCRLGFPFHAISATFDPATANFSLANGVLPIPYFPNEGIHTRVPIGLGAAGEQVKFIETSSPGLMGQSGGPIFDADANVWAIQSRTMHLQLGFSPVVKLGNKEVTEHQFMHVGWGVHVEEILKFLNANGVSHQVSTES